MDRLFLDHLQQFVVVLYCEMPAIYVSMEFMQTKAHWKTLLLNVYIVSPDISKYFTGKCYGATALYEGGPQLILTSIHSYYNRLGPVIICQGSTEKGLTDPGFEALEGCIC